MKVHDLNLTGTSGAEVARAAGAAETPPASGTGRAQGRAGDADRVDFSGALGSIARAVATDGQGRTARVAELTAQYRAGNYHADAAATSRSMVAEMLASGRN